MGSGKWGDILKLFTSILVCLAAGLIGSIFTRTAIPTWYAALTKPSFTPPNWLFAPVWAILYILMGLAAYLVWRKGWEYREVRVGLITFLVQLALNTLWSIVFFGLKSPLGGAIVIVGLWVVLLFTILRFFKVSAAAGWLLVPYILWVSFAAALNISVWILNPQG
ncbi:MAG: tryptophan-rich sensory protein [Chloroflexi bacterium]|nr:tryptophan-rich sensory protein [Chloroflexota bacterium]MBM3175916.1 tryptophan-rich sensory protein [Chloroflexota bacterium]MBM4453688.1 tryptophan-rich sensory protein [Chloroflexota bacterium]